jgi:Lrp/AsnC family transcriptional regulator, leucine-responsive regulatory protein
VAKKAAKDAVTKPVKDTVTKPVKDTVTKPVKDAATKPVKDTAKKPVKDAVTKPVKDTAKKHVKDVEKDAVKKPAKDAANNIARDEAADPVDEGLKLIQSKPEGILQSELWKELGVDSRKCSRIVKKLEESGLIDRVEFKKDGIKTYLLRAKQQPVNPADLLAGDELIPCIGCELECVVEECHPLMDWMYQLAIVEHTEE